MKEASGSPEATACIGEGLYGIVLLQVIPGQEPIVAQAIQVHFADRNHPCEVFFACSGYDLVTLVDFQHTGEAPPENSSGREHQMEVFTSFRNEAVLSQQQFIGYAFADQESDFSIGAGASEANALTLTFYKFHERQLGTSGIVGEQQLIRKMKEGLANYSPNGTEPEALENDGDEALMVGSLGWPDVILLQRGKNLQHLLHKTYTIATSEVLSDAGCLQSYTTPGFRWDPDEGFAINPVEGSLLWQVAVKCFPGTAPAVLEKIRKRYDADTSVDAEDENEGPASGNKGTKVEIKAVFGSHDFIITPHEAPQFSAHALIEVLRFLRYEQEQQGQIVSTNSWLGLDDATLRADPQTSGAVPRINQRYQKEITSMLEEVTKFEDWEGKRDNRTLVQAPQVRLMVNRLQALNNNPGMEGIVEEMAPFVRAAVNKAQRQTNRNSIMRLNMQNRRRHKELAEMENMFTYGLGQRVAGMNYAAANPGQSYSKLFGLGIQRILQASYAIPYGLLSGFRELHRDSWWGFTVFGYQNETYALNSGVINLPYSSMSHPENWWHLGHETGHIFGMIVNLLDHPVFRSAKEFLDESYILNTLTTKSTSLLDELAVSVFEYLFCFRADYDLYLNTTWGYFNHLLEGFDKPHRITEYVFRAVFVFLFDLQHHGVLSDTDRVLDLMSQKQNVAELQEDWAQRAKVSALREQGTFQEMIDKHCLLPIKNKATRLRYVLDQISLEELESLAAMTEPLRGAFSQFYADYDPEPFSEPPTQQNNDANQKPWWQSRIKALNNDRREPNKKLTDRLLDIYEQLRQGVIQDKADNPFDVFLIPLALQYGQDMNTANGGASGERARIAAILSLWSMQRHIKETSQG